MSPQIGDIWLHGTKSKHYLILKEDESLNYDYVVLVMETGKHDRVNRMHFVTFCKKVA